jgi:DNA-binding LacI/PurR family transcriptional regulator/DNA-binding transcriptional regulator YhcF (GntR family)
MKRSPLQAQARIEQQLLSMLGAWWPEGSRLPPTNILAEWLGTGQRNTHQALRELTRQGFLSSRRGTGTFVIRVPDGAASATSAMAGTTLSRSLTGKTVAIVSGRNTAQEDAIATMEARLRGVGVRAERVARRDSFTCDLTTYTKGVAGIVLVYPDVHSPVRTDERVPLAIIASSRVVPIDATARVDFVSVDEQQAGMLAGRYARQLGSERPCFVGRDDVVNEDRFDETSEIRLRGFEEGLHRRVADRYRLHAGHYGTGSGQQAASRLLQFDPLPDFVFAVTDEVAIGLLTGTAAQGVHAGRDYALLGFDGTAAGRDVAGGPLSTVRRPEEAMANLAIDYLLDRMLRPDQPTRRTQLGGTIFVGATSRPLDRDARQLSEDRALS